MNSKNHLNLISHNRKKMGHGEHKPLNKASISADCQDILLFIKFVFFLFVWGGGVGWCVCEELVVFN